MLNLTDTYQLKNRFGMLLSRLYTDGGFSLEEIQQIIIQKNYFDFLEMNEPEKFLNDSDETIIRKEFNKKIVYSRDPLSEFCWAGTMYMSICLNRMIPLRQAILLCPIEKMLHYFPVYHEMSDEQLINVFLKSDYTDSILKKLRKTRKLTVRQLSLTTDIPELTLKHYEKNNDHLFNASFENIIKLKTALGYSESYFCRYSNFTPFTYYFIEDKEIFFKLGKLIDCYYNSEARYEFDGNLFIRIKEQKKEYVPDLFVMGAIRKMLIADCRNNSDGKLVF